MIKKWLEKRAENFLRRRGYTFFCKKVDVPYGILDRQEYKIQEIVAIHNWVEPSPVPIDTMRELTKRELSISLYPLMKMKFFDTNDSVGGMKCIASIKIAVEK